jgi:hypothetical protein
MNKNVNSIDWISVDDFLPGTLFGEHEVLVFSTISNVPFIMKAKDILKGNLRGKTVDGIITHWTWIQNPTTGIII